MPIDTVEGDQFSGTTPSGRMVKDLKGAIALLQFADLFRGSGTITKFGKVRIDVQGPWSKPGGRGRLGANIQAQVGNETIAAIRVADTLGGARGATYELAVVEAVQDALRDSAQDGNWRNITGTSP